MPKDRFIAWIAEEDGKVIGTSGLCFYTLAPSHNNMSGGVAYIQNMYTLPEYRGRGIAKVLFDKVLTEAKERGYKKTVFMRPRWDGLYMRNSDSRSEQ
jgi:GNAT superfamily N-acetyltransferase